MQALSVIGIIIEIVILFNFVILVHELGHFLAARWRGLQVDKFQIWFGKPIWSKTINGVQWGIGCIPAGGFVALPQMAPMEMLEGKSEYKDMKVISPMDKIIVAFAGPLFSFMLAGFFAVLVWFVKHPVSNDGVTTAIGYVSAEYGVAGSEQLQAGDVVLEVDNRPVKTWRGMVDSVTWNVISSGGDTIPFKVQRPGVAEPIVVELAPPPMGDAVLLKEGEAAPEEETGLVAGAQSAIGGFFQRPALRHVERMGVSPKSQPMTGKIYPNSPAAQAGLQPSDVIIEANGQEVTSAQMINDLVQAAPDKALEIVVQRGEEKLNFSVLPAMPKNAEAIKRDRPMLGLQWDLTGVTVLKRTPPLEQMQTAVKTMYNTLAAVFTPSSGISAKHLSGPVGIMRVYYLLFEDKDGWRRALWFSVILNINLGIMNLLPLPVLDGGHITMAILESIRRRPLSKRLLDVAYGGCAILLIGFMIFIPFLIIDMVVARQMVEPVF